jgi:hypothetical protein
MNNPGLYFRELGNNFFGVKIVKNYFDADPGSCGFLTPGFGMGEKIRIRIRDEQPGSYFRELRNNFLG